MNKTMKRYGWSYLVAATMLFSAPAFVGCNGTDPDPQSPGTGTTPPGSTTTPPGTGTVTNPPSSTTSTPGNSTVVPGTDYIKNAGNLTFLSAAIARAGLEQDLRSGSLTIFAPSDDAFKAAGYASAAAVSAANAADLKRILQYHVLGSQIDQAAFPTAVNTSYQTTLSDGRLSVYKTADNVISVNNAKVVQVNIAATNGVIHVIDKVLMPPTVTVLDFAKGNADLSFFAAAVERAGTTVQNSLAANAQNGITVFAPTNAAFKAAGYADEAAVRAANAQTLANLLNYHVLTYRAFSSTFQNGADLVTAQGTSIRTNVSAGKVTILGKGNGTNVANVTSADQVTTNGVVHIIDRVLMPQ